MGFELAIAVVVPSAAEHLYDVYNKEGDSDDMFSDSRVKGNVPGREWQVLRFLDFGRVRALEKKSSSLSPEERASGDGVTRASVCTASFLLPKFWEFEDAATEGSLEYAVPFIADHLLYARNDFDSKELNYKTRWTDIFATLGTSDVVSGLWTPERMNSLFGERVPLIEAIRVSSFWEYNRLLIRHGPIKAMKLSGVMTPLCGLIWVSAFEVAKLLDQLLIGKSTESVFLRKDELSVTIVSMWREMFRMLSNTGVRCIVLTGGSSCDEKSITLFVSQ